MGEIFPKEMEPPHLLFRGTREQLNYEFYQVAKRHLYRPLGGRASGQVNKMATTGGNPTYLRRVLITTTHDLRRSRLRRTRESSAFFGFMPLEAKGFEMLLRQDTRINEPPSRKVVRRAKNASHPKARVSSSDFLHKFVAPTFPPVRCKTA